MVWHGLEDVAVGGKSKNSNLANSSALNVFNFNGAKYREEHAQRVTYSQARDKGVARENINVPNSLKEDFERGWKAENDGRLTQLLVVAAFVGSPSVAAAPSLFAVSTDLWGAKVIVSVTTQTIIKGPSQIDIAGVAADAFTAPGLGAVINASINWTPFIRPGEGEAFSLIGVNKNSIQQIVTDGGVNLLGGLAGDAAWGPLNAAWKPVSTSSVGRSIEGGTIYISTQTGLNTGKEALNKGLNTQ